MLPERPHVSETRCQKLTSSGRHDYQSPAFLRQGSWEIISEGDLSERGLSCWLTVSFFSHEGA